MNLVTVQNIFVSWSLTLVKDSIPGSGSLVYLKTTRVPLQFFIYFFFSF